MSAVILRSSTVVALCFAMAVTTHGNATGTSWQFQHHATTANTEQSSPVSQATLISPRDETVASVVATAIRDTTPAAKTHSASQLPRVPAHNDAIGTGLRQQLLSRGQQTLTPGALDSSIRHGEGINIHDTAAAMDTRFSKDVIVAGLGQLKSRLDHIFFHTIQLNNAGGILNEKLS